MKKTTYQGKYITTSEEEIDGHIYERTELMENIHVLPIKDNKILLMKEFRTHEKGHRWKLVSGWCDKNGKTPLEHAKEELAEEIGMQARQWDELFHSNVPNATVNLNTHYFICTDVSELETKIKNPDSSAVLDYKWFTFNQIFTLIQDKKMWPGESTMVALLCLYNSKNPVK